MLGSWFDKVKELVGVCIEREQENRINGKDREGRS